MKIVRRDHIPVRIKLFAWLNIGVQILFPLTMSFTPAIAGAGSNGRLLSGSQQTTLQTRPYTLGAGKLPTAWLKNSI
ncbi:hypothetical protein ACFFJN_00590 [Erwinia mallotivora]|uniref:hypothetical protein n=1 Tax=Erwinia mallotivora TaxID=69222 RepID=UPI0035EBBA13